MHEPRCVFLFHFEDDLVWVGGGVGDDFGGEGAGGGHYFGDAWIVGVVNWGSLELEGPRAFSCARRWWEIGNVGTDHTTARQSCTAYRSSSMGRRTCSLPHRLACPPRSHSRCTNS